MAGHVKILIVVYFVANVFVAIQCVGITDKQMMLNKSDNGASEIMWHIFQQLNRFPSIRRTNAPGGIRSTDVPSHPKLNSIRMSNSHTTQRSSLHSFLPELGPERPFEFRLIQKPYSMLQLIGLNNYDAEFLAQSETQVSEAVRKQYSPATQMHLSQTYFPSGRLKGITRQDWSKIKFRLSMLERAPMNPNKYSRFARSSSVASHRTRRRAVKERRKRKKMIKQLFATYTHCPVHYQWTDLGPRYWPRWIKQGQCENMYNTSCSLPPGMYCQEAEFKDVTVLRYFCPTHWPSSHCGWYRMRIPVLIRCQCACEGKR